jgi:NAD(P)-dependent dehydrogenase (short-subunit alcohol dehydrogenase family)
MKIAITGHSKGIGKAIAEYFEQQGHTVIGFSRSNGFDITDELSRQHILGILGSCDVFINNAYAPQAQKQLLINVIQLWEGTTNTIINVDSKSTLMKTVPAYMEEYVQDKSQQKELIKNRIFKARPHIINFTVGLVDTDMAKVFDAKKINPTNLAKFIYTLIEFKSTVAVQDVLVEVPDLDWDDIKKV